MFRQAQHERLVFVDAESASHPLPDDPRVLLLASRIILLHVLAHLRRVFAVETFFNMLVTGRAVCLAAHQRVLKQRLHPAVPAVKPKCVGEAQVVAVPPGTQSRPLACVANKKFFDFFILVGVESGVHAVMLLQPAHDLAPGIGWQQIRREWYVTTVAFDAVALRHVGWEYASLVGACAACRSGQDADRCNKLKQIFGATP